MADCPSRAPRRNLPAGMTMEAAAAHPRYRHLLEPEAPCTLESGHDPPHANGLLRWYDPPLILIGGQPAPAETDE